MSDSLQGGYQALFPAAPCSTEILYYASAEADGGVVVSDPAGAPNTVYKAVAANDVESLFSDNFENNLGWTTIVQGASAGQWQRGVPVNDPNWEYDPETDADGSGQCWLTQNTLGNSDVDGGSVTLISPALDLTGGNLTLLYSYYLRLTVMDGVDRLHVEISSNGTAGPWTTLANYTLSSGTTATDHEGSVWTHEHLSDTFISSLGVTLTNNMRVRFTANDSGTASIVEAAVDAVEVQRYLCDPGSCTGDFDSSGGVGVPDLLAVINSWGPCGPPCPADISPSGAPDGTVGVPDLLAIINAWGPCP
jgi:hypothetical protein